MGIRSQLLSCLAIVAAGAFAQSAMPVGQKEFMIGRGVPIWIAHYYELNPRVDYIRIYSLADDLVGHELAPPSEASVQESAVKNKNVSGTENATVVEDKVIYPSVLLVMDYHRVTPLADPNSEWHPGQLLVYASAFWHSVSTAMKHLQNPRVSMQITGTYAKNSEWHPGQLLVYASAFWHSVSTAMKHLQNPRVSMQITGIVMTKFIGDTKSRKAASYLSRDEGAETFSKALPAMMNHWRNLMNTTSIEFPHGAFDIVVHMTDVKPLNGSSGTNGSEYDSEFVAATQGSPCELEDQIAGIIIGDEMKFEGVSRAAEAMTKVLTPYKEPESDLSAAFNKIREGLREPIVAAVIKAGEMIAESVSPSIPVKNVSCMSAPKTIYPRGEALEPVYAPYLDKKWPECQIPGYYNVPKKWRCEYTDAFAPVNFTDTQHMELKWVNLCNYYGVPVVKGCTL